MESTSPRWWKLSPSTFWWWRAHRDRARIESLVWLRASASACCRTLQLEVCTIQDLDVFDADGSLQAVTRQPWLNYGSMCNSLPKAYHQRLCLFLVHSRAYLISNSVSLDCNACVHTFNRKFHTVVSDWGLLSRDPVEKNRNLRPSDIKTTSNLAKSRTLSSRGQRKCPQTNVHNGNTKETMIQLQSSSGRWTRIIIWCWNISDPISIRWGPPHGEFPRLLRFDSFEQPWTRDEALQEALFMTWIRKESRSPHIYFGDESLQSDFQPY